MHGMRGVTRTNVPVRVAAAFPGGFEFGGIGRMMLYAKLAFKQNQTTLRFNVLDARGTGRLVWMPVHLTWSLIRLIYGRYSGNINLVHLNVAGRGSTLRKILLSEIAGLVGLPTIVHLHDFDYGSDLKRRSAAIMFLIRRMFQSASKVVVLGLRDHATITQDLSVPADRVTVLANAVPDPGVPPDRSHRKGQVRLLFLGHLDERKGVPELVAALATARLRNVDWHLDLAGAGEVQRFRTVVSEMELEDRVTFHGWVRHERVYELSRAADIFVLPSRAEGQAMSLIEAMAHGLAIIATPVGAHLEAVTHDVEASLVAPGDARGLADALFDLISNPVRRRLLGEAARRRYLEAFTSEAYARRLAEIYQSALQNQ